MQGNDKNKVLNTDLASTRLFDTLDEFEAFTVLDSQNWQLDPYSRYEKLIAAGLEDYCCIPFSPDMDFSDAWKTAASFLDKGNRWIFGILSYDVKNAFEKLHSSKKDTTRFPWLILYEPKAVLSIHNNNLLAHGPKTAIQKIKNSLTEKQHPPSTYQNQKFLSPTSKAEYLGKLAAIQQHIAAGDVYGLNYCMEFSTPIEKQDLLPMYHDLMRFNQSPMSGYFRFGEFEVLSASPERYIQKHGEQLTVQPIKGTRRRGHTEAEDRALMDELRSSEKERAENVMIVDLMRNDLSRICKPGSVSVPELFGIYGFQRVHQMISTVTGQLMPDTPVSEIIRHTFPMGSMTGAPKIKAMELIEKYEQMRRGAYSGSMGYIDPQGNMDFNVLIRSLVANTKTGVASFCTGGAIVYDSIAEEEYEECLLKASSLLQAWKGVL